MPEDNRKAKARLQKAADQGDVRSQFELGIIYDDCGDRVQAHKWLNLAAAFGHKNAMKACDIVEVEMTPQEITEAHRLTDEWEPKK